eukprot:1996142-Alexandrium_andersonii.AAC.1
MVFRRMYWLFPQYRDAVGQIHAKHTQEGHPACRQEAWEVLDRAGLGTSEGSAQGPIGFLLRSIARAGS